MEEDMEQAIRLAAFQWLEEQTARYGDVLPRKLLENGFDYQGRRVTLIGPAGIWKPKVFESIPLSITTVYNGPYDDVFTPGGLLRYSYRGTAADRNHRDNAGLRQAMTRQVPLIYFHGVVPGKYLAVWPVYIVQDHPESLSFSVAVDEPQALQASAPNQLADDYASARRQYQTSITRVRLHQKSFRERVLTAYHEQCAFCRLRHANLLDAAHIIGDRDEMGDPVVSNGLSLCKIHHAAFDANILGVSPDYIIQVREDILLETDGPMLKHGIQELQDLKIILPSTRREWPDRDRLAVRYDQFRHAG